MKNYKTVFRDIKSRYEFECFHDIYNEKTMSINIDITDNINDMDSVFMLLDIDTAIKLTKVLRAEINEAKRLNEELNK